MSDHNSSADYFLPLTDLQKEPNPYIRQLYQSTLIDPLSEFLGRPKKSFRSELVRFGFELARETIRDLASHKKPTSGAEESLKLFEKVIEMIHSGSLIIDDIEDETTMRRGRPALHKMLGLPLALNAGNWLYFWPLVLLQSSNISDQIKSEILQQCNSTLLWAHTGQALDLGTSLIDLPQTQIANVVQRSIELKSGALTALALKLGALACYESAPLESRLSMTATLNLLQSIGMGLGRLLQMNDDAGNLLSKNNPDKQFEDLRLFRPSFVWSVLAETSEEDEFKNLLQFVSEKRTLVTFQADLSNLATKIDLFKKCRVAIDREQNKWLRQLESELPQQASFIINQTKQLIERLAHAY
jgi:geranylgeranyl pyrophosphate synthase